MNGKNYQLTESDIVQLLGQQTPTVMDVPIPDEQKHQNVDDFPIIWQFGANTTISNGNDKDEVLKSRLDKLEAKNRFLVGKLDTMDVKAKIHERYEKTRYAILNANNESLAKIIGKFKEELNEEHQRKMDALKNEFDNRLTIQHEEYQKEMAQLESKNRKMEEKFESMQESMQIKGKKKNGKRQNAQMNELKIGVSSQQNMDDFCVMNGNEILIEGKEESKELDAQSCVLKKKNKASGKNVEKAEKEANMANNQLEETVAAYKQKITELTKEMAILKEQQKKTQISTWVRRKYEHLEVRTVGNPKENILNRWSLIPAPKGLFCISHGAGQNVFAFHGFPMSGKHAGARPSLYSGTVVYYYEVTQTPSCWERSFFIGLADKNIYEKSPIGMTQHSYSIEKGCRKCYISGREFELPLSTIKPKCNGDGDVYGCGLLRNKSPHDLLLAIFFTLNGTLVGQPIRIFYSGDLLYPTVTMFNRDSFMENFGDDAAKPFKYDIEKCPGMVFL